MSQTQEEITQPTSENRGFIPWKSPIFWIACIATILVAALAVTTLATQEAVGKEISEPVYSTNPELKVFLRDVEIADIQAIANYLEFNPELMLALRYQDTKYNFQKHLRYYHENPELKLAQRMIRSSGLDQDSLTTNPELQVHRRFNEATGR